MLLFDGGDAPLAPFGTKLAGKASTALSSLGVELHMHSIVTEVDADGLQVRDAGGDTTRYAAGTVLWAAGVAAAPLADAVTRRAGPSRTVPAGIKVGPDLTLPGTPGDLGRRRHDEPRRPPGRGRGRDADRLPRGPADPALESGRTGTKPFNYHDLGSAAYISRGRRWSPSRAVHVSGKIGWLAWLGIHLMFLTSFRNRSGACSAGR